MSQQLPPPVRIIPKSWLALVQKQWGEDWKKPDPAYEFSNGRTFDTPSNGGGPYDQSS